MSIVFINDDPEQTFLHIYDIFMRLVLFNYYYIIEKYSKDQLIYYINYYFLKHEILYLQDIYRYYIQKILILNNINNF